MVDDDRPGEPATAGWLGVEPLDQVTRRRLVARAMRESAPASPPESPPRAWRWIAATAAVVAILVGGLAIVTARGGHDEERATREQRSALTPTSGVATPDVGDFGDLDRPANLGRLRAALKQAALEHAASSSSASSSSKAAAPQASTDAAGVLPQLSVAGCARGVIGTPVATGTGTIDGRPVTVVLLPGPHGTSSIHAVFRDSCDVRELGRR